LIFSNPFRRLAKKTQVHPLSKNDHVHNRLTHSLEVASVGRSLGLKAGMFLKGIDKKIDPYDVAYIIQTACLAHDIGNPPFGHAGEEVIKEWFTKKKNKKILKNLSPEEIDDFCNFDGNAQSFRIVTQLENNTFKGGLRLTFATLGTLVKYPYLSNNCKNTGKSKFNCFKSEEKFFRLLFKELDLTNQDGTYRRHPFSYLMEVSDDICYGLLDIQDAYELNIVDMSDLKEIFDLLCTSDTRKKIYKKNNYTNIQKISKLVAIAIDSLARHSMKVFEKNYKHIISNQQPTSLLSIFEDKNLSEGLKKAKKLGIEKIFNEKRKIELELGAYDVIETLLKYLIKATYELYIYDNKSSLSFRSKRALELMGDDRPEKSKSLYKMYQRVVDYIVGMTDNYAGYISAQLDGMGY